MPRPGLGRVIRTTLLLVGAAILGVAGLVTAVHAYSSGSITVLVRFQGTQTYTLLADPANFYQWLAINAIGGTLMLSLAIIGSIALFSKRGAVFAQVAVENMEHRAPSGLRPLWLGLLIAAAICVYVAL